MESPKHFPPNLAGKLLQWFIRDDMKEEVLGDLEEQFYTQIEQRSLFHARLNYWYQVFNYLRPFAIRFSLLNNRINLPMLKHNIKISWRFLRNNKLYSFINIGGLAVGMAIAMLIGLYCYDELTFNTQFEHHDHIAQVFQNRSIGGEIKTWTVVTFPLAEELRKYYGENFDRVVMARFGRDNKFEHKENKIIRSGWYMESGGPELFSLHMLEGNREDLTGPNDIFLSLSLANTLFKGENALGKTFTLNKDFNVRVVGVYENAPENSILHKTDFIGSWNLFLAQNQWVLNLNNPWGFSGFALFVQKKPHLTFDNVSENISSVILDNVTHDPYALASEPITFLHPMHNWHLQSTFKNGVPQGGRIQYVWLFSIIGIFVLALACINFINLSTARSQTRAKEVGIRKTIGSSRSQLIHQFLIESILISLVAYIFSLGIVEISLQWFDNLIGKQLELDWMNYRFEIGSLLFVIMIGILAGSYPAFYLSNFSPGNILNNLWKQKSASSLPRRILVVFQFAVSVVMIIGTFLVYQQIRFAQNRPLGYDLSNLILINVTSGNIHKYYEVIKNELQSSGAVISSATSTSPTTNVWSTTGDFNWEGKDPDQSADFPNTGISYDYGKTIGWKLIQGREFSKDMSTDTAAYIINETAARYMQMENPVGETLYEGDIPFTIIGVVKDMLVESPYQPIRPYFYHLATERGNLINIRLNPSVSLESSMKTIETIIRKQDASLEFNFNFVDEIFREKFDMERKVGKLSTIFSILSIFISLLGLFGLVAYISEQKTKEIGIRKVLGARVIDIWHLVSREYVKLMMIAWVIASPLAFYFCREWLRQFDFRTPISWWIFVIAGLVPCIFTLVVVSFQTIKAATKNPVDSLRNE